uniref:Uncharacterized protein MANES_01G151800 n=1 Tax=Rhizophora mucronata TaxID=61149 RepID=A0A2P2K0Q4_RHIMU
MEANSIFCSASFPGPIVHRPVLSHRGPNKRGLLVLPAVINRQQGCGTIVIDHKNLIFCPKAAHRESSEPIGVPTSVPVRVAHELVQAGHRYLDVRTPEEFSAGHAVGAINVPYMYRVGSGMTKNPNFLEDVSSNFGKYDEIVVVRA